MLVNFPLFLISFAIYNMFVFITPGVSWGEELFRVPLHSGAAWPVSLGDGLLALSVCFLFIEMLKAARAITRSMFDHVLAFLILAAAFAEFLLLPQAATSVFALLLLMATVDLLAGWSFARREARRNFTMETIPDNPG